MMESLIAQIPNETPIPVVGTLMDFTSLHSLTPSINEMNGGGMPGIDHAFCLRGFSKEKILRPVAKYSFPIPFEEQIN